MSFSFVTYNSNLVCCDFKALLLDPEKVTVHASSHLDNEEEVVVLTDTEDLKAAEDEKEEQGTRGEEWDEVRILFKTS